jgi:hypothetical protein
LWPGDLFHPLEDVGYHHPKMGQTLSIDAPTNVLFDVVVVIVGVITILQIAHLALPNKHFTGKTFYAVLGDS